MDELLEILNDIDSSVDYEAENQLIDKKIYDSFSIIRLITEISDTFDIEISPKYIVPEYFNSAKTLWEMIQMIREES